ncbi:MAG: hypothetical protein ACJA15_000151 [Flavobacteriales bacterium]
MRNRKDWEEFRGELLSVQQASRNSNLRRIVERKNIDSLATSNGHEVRLNGYEVAGFLVGD